MTSLKAALALLVAAAAVQAAPAPAQSLSLQDSFRIGSGASTLCTAQSVVADRALTDMFDRGYSIICRDAALPVGQIYALRTRRGDPVARLAAARADRVSCESGGTTELEGLGPVETLSCRLASADVTYRVYVRREAGTVYIAEGLGGYDSALQLGLRSIVADREVEGEVSVATTGAGDPAAFARVQAGALDAQRALAEAYRRNNAGSYAESAEFFSQLATRDESPAALAEAIVNEALQKSNLGRYPEADVLFARAEALAGSEPVTARRLRNYRTMHMLNQGLPLEALAELDRPLADGVSGGTVRDLVIDRSTAARLSAESPGAQRLGSAQGLTPEDKAQILDGQAAQLRGTALRVLDRDAEAIVPLNRALDELVAIRGGRIAATVWMRAQILGELAGIAEDGGNQAEAERLHRSAVALLETDYPGSSALLSAKGRLAGHYVRTGRADQATTLYREIVAALGEGAESAPSLRRTLAPYFGLLVQRGDDPGAAAELFAASQLLVRPGVAQTQAVLARELSGGSDEAARLFRQAVTLTRDIERSRVELARIEADPALAVSQASRASILRTNLDQLRQDQVATQAGLAAYPRYRVVSGNAITLAELQALLGPGEAYYKMMVVGDDAYGIFATRESARAYRIPVDADRLERQVDDLRATISIVENNQQLTYPFDLELAHSLYQELFAPVHGDLAAVNHLIFEPDGPLLRLPPNLLVMDQASIDAYRARAANPEDDGFDFRGVEWLGRARDISTAVSARAFRDVRQAPASDAAGDYIGFGQNLPTPGAFAASGSGTRGGVGQDGCAWPLLAWNRPISADELYAAKRLLAGNSGRGAEVVTGADFTDTGLKQRQDLDQYRIVHFATHGLVTGPRPECPAQPALLTSFGAQDSDGLLTFAEIFDLRLDADLIILSACDTAGHGSRTASEQAGLGSGGDFALDGLVRAFVGAGGRIVVASHWPVPDDFNATQRLIGGLFTAPPGTGTAGALRAAELALMDRAETSHPYYWSGFAIVGDGRAPVIRPAGTRVAARR